MFNPHDADCAAFDRAFARCAPALAVRAETPADDMFLHSLFLRCSPLAGMLPLPMLEHQAVLQRDSHRRDFPSAMRRLLLVDGEPGGHIVIAWRDSGSVCVDVAVLPDFQGAGIGRHLLESWLDVVDARGVEARLTVLRDNPALRLYTRLGFEPVAVGDPDSPHLAMRRNPGAARG